MGQQSLSETAPEATQQFKHNLSIASSSKSDKQRQEGLSYLTSQLSQDNPTNPVGTHTLLVKLLPLVSDSSTPVRSQLLKLVKTLPAEHVRHDVEAAAMFIRSGMTNLSADISNDALSFMDWLLDAAGEDLVSCPGGWVKTLKTFAAMLGWMSSTGKDGWSSGGRATQGRAKASLNQAKTIETLTKFLRVGFEKGDEQVRDQGGKWDYLYRISRDPNAFAYLNLTGIRRDEDGEMYADRESRQRVFYKRFLGAVKQGIEAVKKEGGNTGRAASSLDALLQDADEGMGDYEPSGAIETDDLLELW